MTVIPVKTPSTHELVALTRVAEAKTGAVEVELAGPLKVMAVVPVAFWRTRPLKRTLLAISVS